ncbi:MBL fold metallo-hydrolase [Sphaerotilus sp.]|uniref:MBL fold metallo-hydrolase n=1 Tax=Sphaerotilus sp. TaxID=2093942 RepID=UPI00286D7B56|nr:MBL fold metallo-hydrolase [Sphaerotilus sp.]
MFRIEMLPAAHGDCLWIEHGDAAHPRRLLIDGGPSRTYAALRARVLQVPTAERRFDALVITHIDADHIEGVVRLLQDAEALGCTFDRIWFNGRDQLDQVPDPAGQPLGALQGELLGLLIADYERRTGTTVWNVGWPDRLAAIDRADGRLPSVDFGPGGCRLTLLSPDHRRLLALKDTWRRALEEAGIASGDETALRLRLAASPHLRPLGDGLGADGAGPETVEEPPVAAPEAELDDALGGAGEAGSAFGSDASEANGSSIALLLEYPSERPTVRLLLAGDAWASVLEASIGCLSSSAHGERLTLTGFKLPHHGSVRNLTAKLLRAIDSARYLVSTSGAVFGHPNARAIDLVLAEHPGPAAPQLLFNYRRATTTPWAAPERQQAEHFVAIYPPAAAQPTVLAL